jgi:hypothetical protein
MKALIQIHTALKQHSWVSNPDNLPPRLMFLIIMLLISIRHLGNNSKGKQIFTPEEHQVKREADSKTCIYKTR